MSSQTKYSEIPQNDSEEKDTFIDLESACSVQCFKTVSYESVAKNSIRRSAKFNHYVDLWTQKNLNSQLLQAIYDNDLEKVEIFLSKGANPNSTCRTYKSTAVHVAVLNNSEEILLKLIKKGAKVTGSDRNGLTPLHYAAWLNNHDLMKILLEVFQDNADKINYVNQKADKNKFPHVAECLKDSLDHNCSTMENEFPRDIEEGSTALHLACQKIHIKCVETILENHPDTHVEDDRNLTALEVIGEFLTDCTENVEKDFVQIIHHMQNDIKKTPSSHNYFTPVHAAVMLKSAEGIHFLLKGGFDPNPLDHKGQTPIHLAIIKQLETSLEAILECVTDVSKIRNSMGLTPFQSAVERQWIHGVGLLLSANANICEVAADGRTVLHVAAACGNVDLLEDLLEFDEAEDILNAQNNIGETPIYCAVSSSNAQCVDTLLEKDVDLEIRLEGNINILHRAAEQGNKDILSSLLKACEKNKLDLLNEVDNLSYSGMTPLHMAALNDHVDCVEELLNYKCDYLKKTISGPYPGSLAIHLAAARGHEEVVEALLNHDKGLLWMEDDEHKNPLHCAALYGQRTCIQVLLAAGADLSTYYEDETAIDIIYKNISRPTEFLETIFDDCIRVDDKNTLITDPDCMINIDFNVLLPKRGNMNQMSILFNILVKNSGLGQKKLLLHPLIESFLCLKWNKMNKIFWVLLLLYAVFVLVLTFFVVSLFYYDNDNRPRLLSNIEIMRFCLIALLLTVTIPEILLASQKLKQYTINADRLIKWASILLVTVLAWTHPSNHQENWLRHLATVGLLTCWIEMMFMLSKIPIWGYYVQMFFKVAQNVIKVLTTFSFLIIGFALAFMIEFQSTEPFSNPLGGLIKTIVMLTSELDYSDLFTGENKDNAHIINLTIFVVFLFLGTVVLMNLMVGLAVSDIHDLEIIGKIDRHAQQIDFLSMLENDSFSRFLPQKLKNKLTENKCVTCSMKFYPSHPKCKVMKLLPPLLKESIIDIAEDNVKRDSEITMQQLNEKLDYLIKAIDRLNINGSASLYGT